MSKSWEEYVTDVCVFGRPGRQRDLAGEWEVLFRNASTVASALRDGIRDLEKTFVGAAGDAYRGHLMSIVTQIEKIDADNHQVVHMLEASADSLEVAQGMMPIPDTMLDDVEGHRAELDAANRAGAAGLTAGSAVLTGGMTLAPGMFFHDAISRSGVGDVGRETLGWFYDKVQNWHDDKTRDAVTAFTAANDGGHRAASMVRDPKATRLGFADDSGRISPAGIGPGAGTHAGGLPHMGAGGFKSAASGHASTVPGYDPAHGGGFTPGGGAFDAGATKPWDDSGLAGAGDGGFDGAGGSGLGGGGKGGPFGGGAGSLGAGGLGTGGFGGGAGGFGAGGGLGAGGAGIGGIGSRIGTPVGAPGLTPPPGGGRGAGGAGMMGAPMGGAHGGAGGGDERSTWLEEDEDVWGINDADAPPNLLGR